MSAFFVIEEFRNQGIGVQLVNMVYDEMLALGYETISTWVVDDNAQRWYLKHGWKYVEAVQYHGHENKLFEYELSGA